MDQNINDSNSHIWNSFSENIILGIQPFYIRPHIPVDIIRVFFNFRFSCRKSQSQQKLAKNISPLILQYSFAQKTSPILRTLTHLTLKTICSRNTVNSVLTLKIFQQTCFRLVSEKIFALHHLLTPKNHILEAL